MQQWSPVIQSFGRSASNPRDLQADQRREGVGQVSDLEQRPDRDTGAAELAAELRADRGGRAGPRGVPRGACARGLQDPPR